jgi:hypothetical protein
MVVIGALIGLGSAVAFLVGGALMLFGATDATRRQVVPGFMPDRPGPLERVLTLLGVWGPILFIAALCLLGAIQIVRVATGALL